MRKAVEKYYSVDDVALLLGFSPRWVHSRIQDGSFGALTRGSNGPVKVGGSDWRIPASAVNSYLERWQEEAV